jgi:hypothetical protein
MRVASVPVNAATPAASFPPRPIPVSLSQISRRGTRPSAQISSHEPSSGSSVVRVGIILAVVKRECAAVITSTGSSGVLPSCSGIRAGGNHRSHCAASPGHVSRSAGSGRRHCGRSRVTFSRNQEIDPSQPARSASTVAGTSGNSASSTLTRDSNGANDVGAGLRSYFGGAADPPPARPLTCRYPADVPPAAAEPRQPPAAGSAPNPPLRSPSRTVWVASFSPGAMASFASGADTRAIDLPAT